MKKIILLIILCFCAVQLWAVPIPAINLQVGDAATPQETARTIQILVLITVLTLAPGILISVTSFTRLIVVFSFLRRALGTQTMPPNQVMIALALIITFFIMSPTFKSFNDNALQPYLDNKISQDKFFEEAANPFRIFMFKQVREKDLALFVKLSKMEKPKSRKDIDTTVLLAAFMISEMRKAFEIGFLLFLPFLVIDLVVASILMSMGMMMLPPIMISMPFKILLFILVDGWGLLITSLIQGFK